MAALASSVAAGRCIAAAARVTGRVQVRLAGAQGTGQRSQAIPSAMYSAARCAANLHEVEDLTNEPLRKRPWERSSIQAPGILSTDTEDSWLDDEIAMFVPMTPWPLNMQEVLDMLEPRRIAKYLHVEVPVRVAERIRWIEDIPDWNEIPELAEVYQWHRNTFRELRLAKRKSGLRAFTKVVQDAVMASENMPHKLAFAMQRLHADRGEEYGSHFGDRWLDNFLLNHIGTNFIMAQYLAAVRTADTPGDGDGFAGLIDPNCNVAEICRDVATEIVTICQQETKKRPIVKVEPYSACGDDQSLPRFAFVPGYLRVILMEVLKNSCKATADRVNPKMPLTKMPVTIIVCADEHRVLIRINDRAGGIPFDVGEHVWSYFYSTTKRKEGSTYGDDATELAGYGVGLPLSRLFAKYLGGSLRLVSLPGYGTSVDIELARVSSEQVEQVPDDDNLEDDDVRGRGRGRSSMDHLKISSIFNAV